MGKHFEIVEHRRNRKADSVQHGRIRGANPESVERGIDEGYKMLGLHIVLQACRDYKDPKTSASEKAEIVDFFNSEEFMQYSGLECKPDLKRLRDSGIKLCLEENAECGQAA